MCLTSVKHFSAKGERNLLSCSSMECKRKVLSSSTSAGWDANPSCRYPKHCLGFPKDLLVPNNTRQDLVIRKLVYAIEPRIKS